MTQFHTRNKSNPSYAQKVKHNLKDVTSSTELLKLLTSFTKPHIPGKLKPPATAYMLS